MTKWMRQTAENCKVLFDQMEGRQENVLEKVICPSVQF